MTKNRRSGSVRIGVVGCGYWGPNLIRNFVQIPQAEMVVACDIEKKQLKRMKRLYPFIETTTSFDELLDDGVDAVVIATPLKEHYRLSTKALQAGKHVLVEKPFVRSYKQAVELTKLADKNKLTLMVDHTFEYAAAVNKLKKLIDRGELGSVYTVDMTRVNLGLFQKDHNVVWDLAYHDVSILSYLFGELPVSVICVGEDFIQKGIEDSADVILKFPGKMMASLHLSWLAPRKVRRASFVGSKKMLIYDELEATDKIMIFDKGVSVKAKRAPKMKYYTSFAEFSYLYRSGDIFIPRLDQREPLNVVAEHFVEVVVSGKRPRSGGREGALVVKVVEAIDKSLRLKGKEVKV